MDIDETQTPAVDEAEAGTPASDGDFTGTGTGADGADNTALEGETFPQGDPEPEAEEATTGPLGATLAE